MKAVVYTISIILLTALQTTLVNYLQIFGIKPNLLFVFVVCIALFGGSIEGGMVGLLCGVIIDVIGHGAFGINSLAYLYIGVIVGYLCINFFRGGVIVAIGFVFGTSIVCGLLYYTFTYFMWGDTNLLLVLLRKIIPETIYNTVITLPIYFLLEKIDVRLGVRKG